MNFTDNNLLTPLTEEEFIELDHFLLYEIEHDESMMLDTLDGFLHALAIGPTTVMPQQWLPVIWGNTGSMTPPLDSPEKVNRILSLVMRHFNNIVARLEAVPAEIYPYWNSQEFDGHEYEDAEGWAMGFVDGVKLCWDNWQPLLETTEGSAWYRPIGLLGAEDFGPEQDELTKTPEQRDTLAQQIPESVLAIHHYWLPYRKAVYERAVAKSLQTKVGRNEPCPCASGKKFKRCCGAAADLH